MPGLPLLFRRHWSRLALGCSMPECWERGTGSGRGLSGPGSCSVVGGEWVSGWLWWMGWMGWVRFGVEGGGRQKLESGYTYEAEHCEWCFSGMLECGKGKKKSSSARKKRSSLCQERGDVMSGLRQLFGGHVIMDYRKLGFAGFSCLPLSLWIADKTCRSNCLLPARGIHLRSQWLKS